MGDDRGDDVRNRREAIVREHMDSENRQDFEATLRTFSHPRYELVATSEVYDGPEEVMGYYRTSRATFPDQRNEVSAIHHGDDAVIVEFALYGTQEGPLLGMPATGRSFRCPMIAVFVFDDQGIVNERVYFDSATILGQLGAAAP